MRTQNTLSTHSTNCTGSDTVRAECPKKCSACITSAWDQLAHLMSSIPRTQCSYCLMLRYTLGAWKYNSSDTECPQCLMDDFAGLVGSFGCERDTGECSKCAMDLVTIYLARFVEPCPARVWQSMAKYAYKPSSGNSYTVWNDLGFYKCSVQEERTRYKHASHPLTQGCSSCTEEQVPNATIPSPSPVINRMKIDFNAPTLDKGYDYGDVRMGDLTGFGN